MTIWKKKTTSAFIFMGFIKERISEQTLKFDYAYQVG